MKIITFFFLGSALLFSCGTPYAENKKLTDSMEDSAHLSDKDSLSNKDSIYTIYTSNASGMTMKVMNRNKLIETRTFVNETDTLFYDNGNPKEVRVGETFDFDCKYYTFYRNGKLKRVMQQGMACGMGIQVGEELNYDSLGNLLEKKEFDNKCDDVTNSGHGTRTIISFTEYYPNGKTKSKGQDVTSYEAGGECPCNTWEYYDANGKVIKKEKYPRCEDGNLNCLDSVIQ